MAAGRELLSFAKLWCSTNGAAGSGNRDNEAEKHIELVSAVVQTRA